MNYYKSLIVGACLLLGPAIIHAQITERNKNQLRYLNSSVIEFLETVPNKTKSAIHYVFEKDTLNPAKKYYFSFNDDMSINRIDSKESFRYHKTERTVLLRHGGLEDSTSFMKIENNNQSIRTRKNSYDSENQLIEAIIEVDGKEESKTTFNYINENEKKTTHISTKKSWIRLSRYDPISKMKRNILYSLDGDYIEENKNISQNGRSIFHQEIDKDGQILQHIHSYSDELGKLWIINEDWEENDSSYKVFDVDNRLVETFSKSYTNSKNRKKTIQYFADSLKIETVYKNDRLRTISKYFYNEYGNVVKEEHYLPNNQKRLEYEYSYDKNNNRSLYLRFDYDEKGDRVLGQKIEYLRKYDSEGILVQYVEKRRGKVKELHKFEMVKGAIDNK